MSGRSSVVCISDLMLESVAVVDSTETVADAAAIMEKRQVGFLPVLRAGQLAGVVTARDIVTRSVALGADPVRTRVGALLRGEAISCAADSSPDEVGDLMRTHKVRRLPVVDDEARVVGLISERDLPAASRERGRQPGHRSALPLKGQSNAKARQERYRPSGKAGRVG